MKDFWIYDIETFKHVFTFSIIRADGKFKNTWEVSYRKNEIDKILKCLDYLHDNDCWLVGFNNIGFDYPVVHKMIMRRNRLPKKGETLALHMFNYAQEQIDSMRHNKFGNTVRDSDCWVKQLDLYKINHYDNKAKSTSLKMLEFNMRSPMISDLPYGIHDELTPEQIDEIVVYNEHDVAETLKFFDVCKPMINFRIELTEKYNRSFMNHNDTKIGKDFFIMQLEEAGVPVYKKDAEGKRVPNQTRRNNIHLGKILFDYYDFYRPEFIAVHKWFSEQSITETKGVFTDIPEHQLGDVAQYAELTVKRKKFKSKPSDIEMRAFKSKFPLGWVEEVQLKSKKNAVSYWMNWKVAETLNVVVDGFRFDFGTGGIHGSITEKVVQSNKKWMTVDCDVSSLYPSLAISNNVYPQHLTPKFCSIYKDLYEQRKSYPKGTPENAMLKLALNGTYGFSNDKYTPFYDPQYTMAITVNGQLSLCLLAERLMKIPNMKIVSINTDGITICFERQYESLYYDICKQWESNVKLQLEYAEYSRMWCRDVNNYIAEYTNGKLKRKGAYEYDGLELHKNHSSLIVQKAAEAQMVKGLDLETFIREHRNEYDFMLRTKVPRSSRLVLVYEDGTEELQQNICRYYPSKQGGKLIKIMPPLEEGKPERRLGINVEYNVKTCNDMKDFDWNTSDIDWDFYINEAKKLVIA